VYVHRECELRDQPPARAPSFFRRFAALLRALGDALREGLAAHRNYERLISTEIPHDRALKEALGAHPAGESRYRFLTTRTAHSRKAIARRVEARPGSVPTAAREARIGNLAFLK
jgi:hypothetical protein